MHDISLHQRQKIISRLNAIKRANWPQAKKNHRPTETAFHTAINNLGECNHVRASKLLEVFTSVKPDPYLFDKLKDSGMFCTYLAPLNYDTSHRHGKTIKHILKMNAHDFIKQKTEEQKEMDELWQLIKDLLGFTYQD